MSGCVGVVRVKICCIESQAEACMAIRHGAAALGFVSAMPSGPGVIDEERIAAIASTLPPAVASFLLTSKTDAANIIAQQRRCRVNTSLSIVCPSRLVPDCERPCRERTSCKLSTCWDPNLWTRLEPWPRLSTRSCSIRAIRSLLVANWEEPAGCMIGRSVVRSAPKCRCRYSSPAALPRTVLRRPSVPFGHLPSTSARVCGPRDIWMRPSWSGSCVRLREWMVGSVVRAAGV